MCVFVTMLQMRHSSGAAGLSVLLAHNTMELVCS